MRTIKSYFSMRCSHAPIIFRAWLNLMLKQLFIIRIIHIILSFNISNGDKK